MHEVQAADMRFKVVFTQGHLSEYVIGLELKWFGPVDHLLMMIT